jgi:hypothetical protein
MAVSALRPRHRNPAGLTIVETSTDLRIVSASHSLLFDSFAI